MCYYFIHITIINRAYYIEARVVQSHRELLSRCPRLTLPSFESVRSFTHLFYSEPLSIRGRYFWISRDSVHIFLSKKRDNTTTTLTLHFRSAQRRAWWCYAAAMTTSTSYSSSTVFSIGFAASLGSLSNGRRRIGCHQNHHRFFSRRRRCNNVHTRSAEEKDKFARDTIDLSKRKLGPGTAAPVEVTFLGANGSSVTVDCPTDQYILDAALDAGLELPFTCRGGICGCAARPSSLSFRISLHSSILKTRKILLKLTYYCYYYYR